MKEGVDMAEVCNTLKGVTRINVQLSKSQKNRVLKYTSLYFHELVCCYTKKGFYKKFLYK